MLNKRILCLWAGLLSAPTLSLSVPFHYFNPLDTANVPKLLSQTGAYNNTQTKTVDTAAKYFEVNAALWSDEAAKSRWVILRPGKHIPYNDATDFFDYPDSTVFMKTFKLDKIQGDSTPNTSRVYWETRLLVRKADPTTHIDWYGFSYRWRADQSDADLVSIANGLDTVFYYTTTENKLSYKKWHFPSQKNCSRCHVPGAGNSPFGDTLPFLARGVLGLYPAQLKRPSTLVANTNQVIDLFNKGVFSGTKPDAAALARRFKGVHEPISGTLTADQRFATIDSMARSYIAANCSGCHGFRGMAGSASGQAIINFDWYDLKPHMEFSNRPVNVVGLNNIAPLDTTGFIPPAGRNLMTLAANQWGFKTGAGQFMDMSLPAGDPAAFPSVMIYPGYPALSEILYRQWARNSPAMDSGTVARALKYNILYGDSVHAKERQAWIFSKPWGSQAWVTMVTQHGLTVDKILRPVDTSASDAVYDLYAEHGDQMPIIATFVPDTSALKILVEWVKNYKILVPVAGVANPKSARALALAASNRPVIRDRVLFVPSGWAGTAVMMDLSGRAHTLAATGKGSYVLPAGIPNGVYVFRVGVHTFFTSVL
ncbi:MAG: hypothetical protein JWO30_4038 [Fibrobacteres bacterium]|nr:hypothetical protein [Fibrobacterota bacterium]